MDGSITNNYDGRITKNMFDETVECVQAKLKRWTKFLSFVGR